MTLEKHKNRSWGDIGRKFKSCHSVKKALKSAVFLFSARLCASIKRIKRFLLDITARNSIEQDTKIFKDVFGFSEKTCKN